MKIIKPEAERGIVHRYPLDNIFRYNGWPSVTRDDRGVLYAAASTMRLSHGDPSGKDGMWLSFNEGKTWTPTIIVNDTYYDDRDTGITYVGDGRLIFTWYTAAATDNWSRLQSADWFKPADKAMANGFTKMWPLLPDFDRERLTGSFYMISDDYGVTWSERRRISVFAPHGVNVCRDGSLIYLGKVDFRINGTAAGHEPIAMMTSYDRGETWEMTGEVPFPHDLPDLSYIHEPHVAELPSGRLLGAFRVHDRPAEPANTVYISFSDDKGKTWTEPHEIPGVDGLPPHVLAHSSGAVIISYGCRTAGNRSERAVVSYDGGETWTEDYVLDDNINEQGQFDLGYPASIEMPDGSIFTVYYQGLPTDEDTSILWTRWKLK